MKNQKNIFSFLHLFVTYEFSDHGQKKNFQASVLIIQKHILQQSKYTQSGYTVCFGKPRPRKQFAIKIFRIPQQQNGLNWCLKNIISSEDTDVLSPIFFKNRFDVHGQCLVPSIKKKVNSYSLLLGQQALIALQIQNFH